MSRRVDAIYSVTTIRPADACQIERAVDIIGKKGSPTLITVIMRYYRSTTPPSNVAVLRHAWEVDAYADADADT
eukprot:207893-Pyramimonas_sp.AAC.1